MGYGFRLEVLEISWCRWGYLTAVKIYIFIQWFNITLFWCAKVKGRCVFPRGDTVSFCLKKVGVLSLLAATTSFVLYVVAAVFMVGGGTSSRGVEVCIVIGTVTLPYIILVTLFKLLLGT